MVHVCVTLSRIHYASSGREREIRRRTREVNPHRQARAKGCDLDGVMTLFAGQSVRVTPISPT